jgi:hypothetical protein
MDVTMKKIPRLISINQFSIGFKSTVTTIFSIMDISGRRMGNYDINVFIPPKLKCQLSNMSAHLTFSVLYRAAIIPPGTFEAQQAKLIKISDPAVNISAPHRRLFSISDIVVAADIIQGCVAHAY